MKLTKQEAVWLAACVDFEGSILMYPSNGHNNVRQSTTVLTNTCIKLIQTAVDLLEKAGIENRVVPRGGWNFLTLMPIKHS